MAKEIENCSGDSMQLIDDNLKQLTLCLLLQHQEINGFCSINQKYDVLFGLKNVLKISEDTLAFNFV